jgi:hypothetical protein
MRISEQPECGNCIRGSAPRGPLFLLHLYSLQERERSAVMASPRRLLGT